jgi:hypothetical protein
MRASHDGRLLDREAQTRSWAAPLPDFTVLPRVGEAPRIRHEWDTRDTMNQRLWADTIATGAKTVTSAMLATHPTAGAETMMPTAGRQDFRQYHESAIGVAHRPAAGGVATGLPGMLERPGIPRAGVWYSPSEMETVNAVRDVRGVVRENNGGRAEDAAARLQARTFQNQWMTPDTLRTIVDARLGAAEALRPAQDDWRSTVTRR